MKKQLIIVGLITLLVCVGLSGCNEKQPNTSTDNDEVENKVPIALCSANYTSGNIPLTIQFTGFGTDSDGIIVSYHWSFGDGSTSSEQNATHTYNIEGKYKVTLTVTDEKGAMATDIIYINALIPTPEILEHTSYTYSDDWVSVDGIIKNVADVPINNIELKITLYDKSGNIIKTNQDWSDITHSYSYDYTHPRYIKSGETAFFSVTFEDINYYDHYDFEILSFDSGYSYGCREGLVISDVKDSIDTLGYEVTGNLKNEGTIKHSLITIWGAFYDSSGKLLCVAGDYSLPLDFYSGQEEEFTITVYDWHIDPKKISNYDLKIETFCYS